MIMAAFLGGVVTGFVLALLAYAVLLYWCSRLPESQQIEPSNYYEIPPRTGRTDKP